jgi:hypothetical protein
MPTHNATELSQELRRPILPRRFGTVPTRRGLPICPAIETKAIFKGMETGSICGINVFLNSSNGACPRNKSSVRTAGHIHCPQSRSLRFSIIGRLTGSGLSSPLMLLSLILLLCLKFAIWRGYVRILCSLGLNKEDT